jgi:hypothetical protein
VRVPPGDQFVLPPTVPAVVCGQEPGGSAGCRIWQLGRVGQGGQQHSRPAEADCHHVNPHHAVLRPHEQVHAIGQPLADQAPPRCCSSACRVNGESVNTGWWRQSGNSSPVPAGVVFWSRTRRTISRAVMALPFLDANAV